MSCDLGDPFEIGVGDQLPILEIDTDPGCGVTPINFTLWTSLTFTAEGPITITGPAVGTATGGLSFSFGAGTTDVAGSYQGRFHGISPSGKPQRFPTRGYIQVEILP